MRKYGGFIADTSESKKKIEEKENHKYEFMGEYKHLPESFVNEVWNRSDEYQKMFEDATQFNKKLLGKQEQQDRRITMMKAQLTASQNKVEQKDIQIKELKETVIKHETASQMWEDNFELQGLKTERAHERRIEEEEKVKRLEQKSEKFKKELVSSSSRRKFFETRATFLQSKVFEKKKELERKGKDFDEMKRKIEELSKLLREANKKYGETINRLNEIIVGYSRKVNLLQERHSDVEGLLQKLEIHVSKKWRGRRWKRRRSSFEETTVELFGELYGLLNGPLYSESCCQPFSVN